MWYAGSLGFKPNTFACSAASECIPVRCGIVVLSFTCAVGLFSFHTRALPHSQPEAQRYVSVTVKAQAQHPLLIPGSSMRGLAACCCQVLEERPVGSLSAALAAAASCSSTSSQAANEQQRQHGDASCASSGGGSSSMDMPLTPPAAAAGGSSNSSSESAASPSSYTYSYSCSPMTVVSSSSSSKPADVAASASSVIDEGYTSGTVLASAVQVHYGSCPELVQHMAQRCLRVDVATVTAAAKQAAAVAAAAAVTQQQRSHQLHVVLPDSPEAHQGCSQSSSHDTANMRLPSPGTRALSAPNLQDMVWHQLQPAAGTGDGAAAAAAAATPPPAAGPAGAAGGSGVTDVWFCPAGVADAAVGGGAAAGSSGGMPPAGALSPARKSCSVPGEMWQMAGAASGVPPPAGQHYHYQQQQQYLPYARYQQLQQQPLGFRVGSCPASAQGVMMMHHGASDGSAAAAGGGGPQAAASDSGGLLGQRWAPPAFNVPKRWSMELQRLGTTLTSQLRHVGHSSEGGSPRSVASASSAGQQHSQHQHSSQQQSQRGGGGHHSRNNSRGMMHLPEESPLSEAAIRALDSSLPSLLGRTHHTGIGVAVPLSSTSTGGGSVATASALSSNTTAPYCSNSSGGNLLLNTGGTLDSSMSRSSSVHEQMSSLAASLALQEAAGGKGLTLTPPSAAAGVAQLLTGPGSHTDLDSVTTVCTEPATRSGLTAELVHAQQQQQQHVAGSGVQGWASSLPVHKGPRLSVDHAGFGYGLQAEHSKGSYTRLSLDTPTAFASASATEVDFATAVSAGGGKPPQQHQQQQYHVSSGSPDAEAHLLQPELSFKAGVAAASHQQPLQVHAVGGTTGHLAGVTTTPHSATTAKGSGAELHLLAKKSATSSGSLSGMWAGGTPKSATALAAASAASQYGGSMGALLGSIVSLSPAATDILIALGLSSRVSGVTDSCRLSVRGSSSGGASGSNGCWQVLQLLDGMGAAWMAEAAEAAVNSNTPDVVCRLVAGPDGLPRYKLDEDCIRQLQPSLVVVACDENGGEEQPQGMQQQHHHQKGGSRAAANGSSNSSGSGQAHSSGRGFVGGGGSCTNLMTLSGAVAVPGRVRLDPAVVQRVLQRAGVWGEGRAVVLYQRCHSLAEVMEFMQVLAHAAGVPERGTALVAGLRARLRAAAGRVCMANEALARRSSSFSVSGPRGLSASSSNGSRGRGLRWGSLTGGGGAANGPGGGAGVLGSAAGTAVVGAAAVPGVSVMVLGCTDPLSLVGFWVPEMLQLAGVEPGALSPGPAEAPLVVSWPPLRDAAPDVLVLALPGLCAADAALHLADLAALPGFWGLPAVRAGAVYALDHVLLLRPGPSLVLGLEVLSHLAAPDQQSLPAGLPLGSVLKLGLHGGQRCRPRLVPHYMSRYC